MSASERSVHTGAIRSVGQAEGFGEAEMRQWWHDADPLPGPEGIVIGAGLVLHSTVDRALVDCGWTRR